MKRRILFGVFVCITGMFAVVPFAYAGGSTSFTDPAGDANGAPDIQRIDVSNDDGGTVNFRVQVDAVQKPSDTRVYIFLDTDRNVSTGSAALDGVDYILAADESDNSFDIGRWDGAHWVDAPHATVAVNSDSTGWNFSVNKSELGGTDGFDFWVRTRFGDVSLDKEDTAPENGTFRYMFGASATSPPSTTPATTPAASTPKPKLVVADASLVPHAGASFSFRIDHVVLWAVTYHIATATHDRRSRHDVPAEDRVQRSPRGKAALRHRPRPLHVEAPQDRQREAATGEGHCERRSARRPDHADAHARSSLIRQDSGAASSLAPPPTRLSASDRLASGMVVRAPDREQVGVVAETESCVRPGEGHHPLGV